MENYRKRNKTRTVSVGDVLIGGGNPISVQSMTSTDTRNTISTVEQILELEDKGCEIIRIAIPDIEAASNIGNIKEKINIPLVADIHFDYRLAIESARQGADKIRINPGNIGAIWKFREIIDICSEKDIPIRVGGNTGSIKEKYLKKYSGPTAEALVESVLDEVKVMESVNYTNIVVSLKSSDVITMIRANEIFSDIRNYPIHLGVTESGPPGTGEIYSAVGIGTLLYEGIGDTVRVSITGDPGIEVRTAYNILSSLNLRKRGPRIISCPTCGRLEYNMEEVLQKIEKIIQKLKTPLTIAVMGCSVNGPGEAKEADIGIAGGRDSAVIFKKGKIIATVSEDNLIESFLKELKTLTGEDSWQ